jgi:hypothetical protein
MKLLSWHDVGTHPAWLAGDVADLRPQEAHLAGHPRAAVSLPVLSDAGSPAEAAFSAALPAALLPPRHVPLLLIGDDPDVVAAAVRWLRDRGRERVDGAVLHVRDAPPGDWETGAGRRVLWRPNAFLAAHADLLPPPDAGPVVDLGCGGGREAVWLAQRGHAVTAVDHLPDALVFCERLARDRGVAVRTLRRDLTRRGEAPAGPWALAIALRFLHRPLLSDLDGLLAPGGVAVVRTFRFEAGVERLPKRRYCLEAGELLELFPASRFDILAHVEDRDPDGRPAAGVVARLRVTRGS